MADNKAQTVDFSDKASAVYKGKVSKLDSTQDSFAFPAPAPKGSYDLKLMLGKNGIEVAPLDDTKEISNDNLYYRANLECEIVNNETWEKNRVFPMVTTRIGRGKDLSTMADLIIRLGYGDKLKPEMDDYTVAKLFDAILKKEPVIKGVECDWQGYSKVEERNVFNTMTDFPKDEKGGYQHMVNRTTKNRDKEEVRAMLKVIKWPLGKKKGEEVKKVVKATPKETLPDELEVSGGDDDTLELLS